MKDYEAGAAPQFMAPAVPGVRSKIRKINQINGLMAKSRGVSVLRHFSTPDSEDRGKEGVAADTV